MSLRKVHKGLDTQVPIMFWSPLEATLCIFVLGVGVITKQILIGLGGAYLVLRISKSLSRGAKRGQGFHLVWRLGLRGADPQLGKHMPDPMQVDFTE